MPKIQYPPQGGEKHLCLTLFCTMMLSVMSAVAIIYAIVIIYIPAKTVLGNIRVINKEPTTLFLYLSFSLLQNRTWRAQKCAPLWPRLEILLGKSTAPGILVKSGVSARLVTDYFRYFIEKAEAVGILFFMSNA